jgi:hypothetical protein
MRQALALALLMVGAVANAGFAVTQWVEGKAVYKTVSPNTTNVEIYEEELDWEEGFYPVWEYYETTSDEIGNFSGPIEVSLDGEFCVRVRWDDPSQPAPDHFYLKVYSAVDGAVNCQEPGLAGDVNAENGLDFEPQVTGSAVARTATSEGTRLVRYEYSGGDKIIRFKFKSLAKGVGTEGSYAGAIVHFDAQLSDRSVAVQSQQDLSNGGTYYRQVVQDATTGWKTGVAVKHKPNTAGTGYGDMGLTLYFLNGTSPTDWLAQGSTTYHRQLLGHWNTGQYFLTNEWWCVNPDDYWRDSAVSEWVSVTPDGDFRSNSSPSSDLFKQGKTAMQKIRYKAVDEAWGNSGEALYFMTLHGPRQKEEERRPLYSGYLHLPASTVASKFSPATIGLGMSHSGVSQSAETVEYEITQERTFTYEASSSTTLSAELQAILTLQFGTSTTLTTSSQATVGTKRSISIPPGKSVQLFAVATGTVRFFNWSCWGFNGFEGDDLVVDVDPGNIEIKPVIYPIGSVPSVF